ncbi:zinc-dependent dehydrogenase [Candidatus Hecatella orcuttiae]|jgi:L-iditol 2-dehydrogenase|uniref:zinc-dependent dehydrogenase n=1 Tax=Candidatus Hecatella orcuttiae TaxID=1935119 RepID=UPI0028680D43|nr:zinc-dependent dehydrogenase [Candidatus Hecatella orcuttiae]
MKAAFLRGPSDVRVEDVPIPKIGRGEVLVKMKACGVCGTDVEKTAGYFLTPPVLGHEVVGEVVEVGEGVEGLRVGDRVFTHHHVPCYKCHYCRHGDYTMCEEFPRTNLDPGGFAEYFKVPAANVKRGAVLKIPRGISFQEATLIEPVGCCIRGAKKLSLQPGDDVMIIGAGPAGLIFAKLLKLLGVGRIFVSDLVDFRLAAAEKFGAEAVFNSLREDPVLAVKNLTHGLGVDAVIVATGSIEAIRQGLDSVRKGGTVVLFGAPLKGAVFSYDVSKIFIQEISLIPSYSTTELETNMALRLMETKRLELSGLITHSFKLDQVADALKLAAEGKESLKIIITP